ncbi:MAG: sulfotransferase [Verrucomicrobiales bacterium]|nr:sulfotransferase [Verrucomicrobiales bacterium]
MQSHHKVLFQQAFTLHRQGKTREASKIYLDLIEEGNRSADVLHLYGLSLHELGDQSGALPYIKKAIAMAPDNSLYRKNLAVVFSKLGRTEDTVEQYRKILKIDPDNLEAHQSLAFHLRELRDHTAGLLHAERALELEPGHSATWNNAGNLLNDLGRIEDARLHYRKAVDHDPRNGQAWANLASVTKFRQPSEVALMEKVLCQGELSSTQEGQLCFALGKAWKDIGKPELAFPYYEKANRRVPSHFPWEQFETYVDDLGKLFQADTFAGYPRSKSTERPIFIVGMMRSGTSLVEQILSTHPALCGVGERPELARLIGNIPDYPKTLRQDTEPLTKIANTYRDLINPFKDTNTRSVDKMMTNFLHIGMISLLFPKAKIIHTERNPYAVGLSIFCQNFAKPQGWTSSLDDIGRYYTSYRKMMDHWAAHSPLEIHTVRYEELLSSFEKNTRDLFTYCEEEWPEDCLEFHENRNVVKTASNWQVRQPLNPDNREKWRAFEPYLTDLDKWV